MSIDVDKFAREMYSSSLVIEGFSPETAERMSQEQCPEHFYALAEETAAAIDALDGGAGS